MKPLIFVLIMSFTFTFAFTAPAQYYEQERRRDGLDWQLREYERSRDRYQFEQQRGLENSFRWEQFYQQRRQNDLLEDQNRILRDQGWYGRTK